MPPSGQVVHADDLQKMVVESVFYATLILTVLLAYFFIRELVMMLIGIKLPVESAVPPDLITAYLAFLLGYTGWKQYRKWAEFRNGTGKDGKDDSQVVVPKAVVLRFRRGEYIIGFWFLLMVVSVILAGHGLIPHMPKDLMSTVVRALGIWLGGQLSETELRGRKKKKAAETGLEPENDDNEQQIFKYLSQNDYINKDTCIQATGLNIGKAYRLLTKLTMEGQLVREGTGKATKYRLP